MQKLISPYPFNFINMLTTINGFNVWWLSIMMSEIWGINSSFYLLLGLGDDVSNGSMEIECGGMSFARYVFRLNVECFGCQIRWKCIQCTKGKKNGRKYLGENNVLVGGL